MLCKKEIAKPRKLGMHASISSRNDGSPADLCGRIILLCAIELNVVTATYVPGRHSKIETKPARAQRTRAGSLDYMFFISRLAISNISDGSWSGANPA